MRKVDEQERRMGEVSDRALITGINGFLGRYIARELSERGWRVVGVDIAPQGSTELPTGSVYRCLKLPNTGLEHLLQEYPPSLCVHCAGSASVAQSIEDPKADFHANTALTLEILDTLRQRAPRSRFILLSSAAVYGNPTRLPIPESTPRRPISPYGYHKMQCEILAEEFYTVYGMQTCFVRIFSAYGPGLRRQVLWDICRKVRNKSTIFLSGTGEESRDFVHARDIARGIALVADQAAFQAEAYNIATGRETRIGDLARQLVSTLGEDIEVRFTGESRPGDPLRWCADISSVSRLGYRPTVGMKEGIDEYARWFLNQDEESMEE